VKNKAWKIRLFNFQTGVVSIVVITLCGCSQQLAPIFSLDIPAHKIITNHVVQEGDTLYSIAWRYDLNVNNLVKNNRLSKSTIIYPGQILNIEGEIEAGSLQESVPVHTKLPDGDLLTKAPSISKRGKTTSKKLPVPQKVKKESVKGIGEFPSSKNEKGALKSPLAATRNYWQWPVRGKLEAEFNVKNLQKGITIKTISRASVRATAPGKVVYAGDGLRGYGQLIILKHSEVLLSAYAQNEKILVHEGQSIDNMEIISKLGSSGLLYFEIRKDGLPVDPLDYIN
tara:strand:+ start:411 stop:1262 length:852 start_codon:yes stop_codon:yes gene_type:complete